MAGNNDKDTLQPPFEKFKDLLYTLNEIGSTKCNMMSARAHSTDMNANHRRTKSLRRLNSKPLSANRTNSRRRVAVYFSRA